MSNCFSTDGVSIFSIESSTKPVTGTSSDTSCSVGFCLNNHAKGHC